MHVRILLTFLLAMDSAIVETQKKRGFLFLQKKIIFL